MSNGDPLQIEPTELQFPFELKKQISCSMQLTNKSDNWVAFKVENHKSIEVLREAKNRSRGSSIYL
ncbi:Vesicle-associated protein 3-1 [Orobanche gracilis]